MHCCKEKMELSMPSTSKALHKHFSYTNTTLYWTYIYTGSLPSPLVPSFLQSWKLALFFLWKSGVCRCANMSALGCLWAHLRGRSASPRKMV